MNTTYKNLLVWQKAVRLSVALYLLTNSFPKEEIYGLTSQMRRSCVSIASNIAEGRLRGSNQEFKRFLNIAYASGGELETQIEICKQLLKTKALDYNEVDSLLSEVMRMLNKIISNLNPNS